MNYHIIVAFSSIKVFLFNLVIDDTYQCTFSSTKETHLQLIMSCVYDITTSMPCVSQLQLIGVSVPGLEAEFQPVANYLLPYIISHKQDAVDTHLQVNWI